MTTPAERKALNQATFRNANEELERGARDIVADDEAALIPFLCECVDRSCTRVVLVTLEEYGKVRAHGRRGIAHPGHQDPSVERVVDDASPRFVVTEKFGEAGDVVAETDPRS